MTIFFASHNQGKIKEAKKLVAQAGHQLLVFSDLKKDFLEVEETGATFAQNAELKARAAAKVSQLPTLADDSGLLLNAFPAFPGVNSKRWFAGSDSDRNQALLEKLSPKADRRAKFVTVLALFNPESNETQFFEGEVLGQLAREPAGLAGFGYDPLFIPDGYEQSFAQLGLEIKNRISHRSQAWQKLIAYLTKQD